MFSRQDPHELATKTACSKLSNNAALVVRELAREPAQGLLHVVTHVQRSIPVLLDTHQQLQAAADHLQALLTELQDAQEGVLSITSPATQQDLAGLAGSASSMHATLAAAHEREREREREREQGQASPRAGGAVGSGSSGGGRSSSAAAGPPR